MRPCKTRFFASFILPLALAGCVKPRFKYAPNPPAVETSPMAVNNGVLFPVLAVIRPLDDATEPQWNFRVLGGAGERSFQADLARQGAPGWPALYPAVMSQALADELSASGLVSSATVAGDGDDYSARNDAAYAGARLYVEGQIMDATLEYKDLTRGSLALKIGLAAWAQEGPYTGAHYNDRPWIGVFTQKAALDGRPPAQVMARAVQKLYAQALKSLAQRLLAAEKAGLAPNPDKDDAALYQALTGPGPQ